MTKAQKKKKIDNLLGKLSVRIVQMGLDLHWTLGFLDHFHTHFFLDGFVMVVLKRSDKTYIFLAHEANPIKGLWDAPERLKKDE